jgi:hypothetical protein
MSGGGFWVIPTTVNGGGELEVSGSAVLAGVGFLQNLGRREIKSIRGHWAPDVYGHARSAIAGR